MASNGSTTLMPSGVRIFAISGVLEAEAVRSEFDDEPGELEHQRVPGVVRPPLPVGPGEALAGRPADQRVELPDPGGIGEDRPARSDEPAALWS